MKNQTNSIRTLVLVCLFMIISMVAYSQSIINLSVYPQNATSSDEITLVSETLFGSGPCILDSSFIAINGYDIRCDGYFSTGMLTVMCTSFDTFNLGPLSDGTYQLHYNLYHPSSNPTIKDSTTIVFTIGSVGLKENALNCNGLIYPNPSDGKVFMDMSSFYEEKEIVLSLSTMNGKEIKKIKLNTTKPEISIDLSELTQGTYIYECYFPAGNRSLHGKLIILRDQ